jgi:hypothetical protein
LKARCRRRPAQKFHPASRSRYSERLRERSVSRCVRAWRTGTFY